MADWAKCDVRQIVPRELLEVVGNSRLFRQKQKPGVTAQRSAGGPEAAIGNVNLETCRP